MKENRLEDYAAVIQAGGKGTRLKELTKDQVPKPMLLLNGKPMIEWQIENVRKYGIRRFIIIIGHLGEKIQDYFGNGSRLGVDISYIKETQPLGSAGSLWFLKKMLPCGNFFFLFGDVMFDVSLKRMVRFHENNHAVVTLAVHPNSHPYDSDLVEMDEDGRINRFHPKNVERKDWCANLVNAGICICSCGLLEKLPCLKKLDLEKDLFMPLIEEKNIYGYFTTEYIRDAGTPERFREVSLEQASGLWSQRNLEKKQKCIFLDRDGTLNVYKGLLSDIRKFELEEGAAEAVSLINRSGYLAIVVTNQPVVARGMCSLSDVERIHRKMQTLLGEKGAYLDDIVFCPHHPDKGFPGENPTYKISCDCRKPHIGMIRQMAEKYHIDLRESYMIGDSTTDIQTGILSGTKTVLVRTGEAGLDGKYAVKAEYNADNVLDAVKFVLFDRSKSK